MELGKIMGEYESRVVNCITLKLQEIEDEHKDLLEELEIDFKKCTGTTWNDNAIWFYHDPENPIDKLPHNVRSKVDLVISSCLNANS
jgi:hypothetical protein